MVTENDAFSRLPDGRIVLTFLGDDFGEPARFGIADMHSGKFRRLYDGEYELIGSIEDLHKAHPELCETVMHCCMAAGVSDALSFVRTLDKCLQGEKPSPALSRIVKSSGDESPRLR